MRTQSLPAWSHFLQLNQQLQQDRADLISDAALEILIIASTTTLDASLAGYALLEDSALAEQIATGIGIGEGIVSRIKIAADFVKNPSGAFETAFATSWNAVQSVLSQEKQLATEIFEPTRVTVTGTANSIFGGVTTTIGGPGQTYRNDFQVVGGGVTVGVSSFFGPAGELLTSGPIRTQNFFDSSGNVLHAESMISLPQGTLFRHGIPIGPPSTSNQPPFIQAIEFQFSPLLPANGAFSQVLGLSSFTTTGSVTLATADDGQTVVDITEDPESSLATAVTVPTSYAALVFQFRWANDFSPAENATFTVDFTGTNSVTVPLYQALASDPSVHSTDLQQIVVNLPQSVWGKTGVLRFRLDSSSTDGVTSQVVLGGYAVVATDPPVNARGGQTVHAVVGTDSGLQTVATFSDPGGPASPDSYFAAIDWGDGSIPGVGVITVNPGGGFTVQGNHTYATAGTEPIKVTIGIADTTPQTVTSTAIVAEPLKVTGVAIHATEGVTFSGPVATFTAADHLPTDYAATIHWGDGSATAGSISFNSSTGAFTVAGTHTYAEEGSQTATVTVSLASAPMTMAMASSSVTIVDAPLTGTALTVTPTHGKKVFDNAVVAAFFDPNLNAPVGDFTASINWGDGTVTNGTIVSLGGGDFDIVGSHTYKDAKYKTIPLAVAIQDVGGSSAIVTSTALLLTTDGDPGSR